MRCFWARSTHASHVPALASPLRSREHRRESCLTLWRGRVPGAASGQGGADLQPADAAILAPAGASRLPSAHAKILGHTRAPEPSLPGLDSASPAVSAALPLGCTERYAPRARRRVDPFGLVDLLDLWPQNSTAPLRPRPWPLGPAYNSSEYDVFINTTYVALVRALHAYAAYAGISGAAKLLSCSC